MKNRPSHRLAAARVQAAEWQPQKDGEETEAEAHWFQESAAGRVISKERRRLHG